MSSEPKRRSSEAAREPAAEAARLPGFEAAIERLETIVNELEAGTLTLEESIARYEEGMKLTRQLTRTLEETEKRIERLTEGPDGQPRTEPIDLDLKSPESAPPEGKLPF